MFTDENKISIDPKHMIISNEARSQNRPNYSDLLFHGRFMWYNNKPVNKKKKSYLFMLIKKN